MSALNLADFISSVSGDSLLAVEENLGDGFVRLKTAEAERRQAKHDIRSVEDVVIEMLRNSRDAHCKNIYMAISREGALKNITIIDDGDGIPISLHERVFEPRVTSKLESVHMDKWGVHGRGMALYSIKCNVKNASVVSSQEGLGCSMSVDIDLESLSEKADQSTYPKLERDDDGALVVGRGPHNVIRNTVEFALEHRDSLAVYLGSPTDIASRLYKDGAKRLTDEQMLFCDDFDLLPVAWRPAAAGDAAELVNICSAIGLDISERTAHRIIAGQIEPAVSPLSKVMSSKEEDKAVDLYADHRGLKIAKDDLLGFQDQLEAAFAPLARSYYLKLNGAPKVRVGKDSISVKFKIDKEP